MKCSSSPSYTEKIFEAAFVLLALLLIFFPLESKGREEHIPEEPQLVPIGQMEDKWGMGDLESGIPGGGVIYATSSQPSTFNDLVASDTASTNITGLLMGPGLTDTSPASGRIVPAIAKDWDVSADNTNFTFYLREGAKFSDGEPLTAEDVVFTFNRLVFNESVNTDVRSILEVEGQLPEVTKIDEYTVRFETPVSYGPLPGAVATVAIYPKHLLEGISGEEFNGLWGPTTAAEAPEEIVGAGPFQLSQFIPGGKVVLKRNPYYYRVDPNGTQLPYL